MKTLGVVLLALITLAGCGDETDGSGSASNAATSPAPVETVFDPLTETLERARSVEDTILDAADERLRQIDAQTGVQ